MRVRFLKRRADFRPWRPADGRVLDSSFAFDSETTLIDNEHPWLVPAYVLGAAFDGKRGVFVQRKALAAFFHAHRRATVVMHHAPFDLRVIDLVISKQLDIYRFVDDHRIYDTQLLHRLCTLGTVGHTSSFGGQSTLEHCACRYLGAELPKDTIDSQGKPVRLSYGQWLNRPPGDIEPIYLEYLAKDVMATYRLFRRLMGLLNSLLDNASDAWGYVSADWLKEMRDRWGPQTHHIQLKAAIVLQAVTSHGIGVDAERRDALQQQLSAVLEEKKQTLRQYGYMPGQPGSGKALQEILRQLEREHPDLDLKRTDSGKYATSEESLSSLSAHDFIRALLEFNEVQKLLSTFLGKMVKSRLHPSFDVLKTTGRTSSFGEINAQNLPRDDRVRSCFRPAEGHVFIDADYSTIELATLAQATQSQFGLESEMLKAINAGKDLHRLVAARMLGKPESSVTSKERQMAKPINFGKPGGMGASTLKSYALASYRVELGDDAVQALSDSWFELFPEMKTFLGSDDLGGAVAESFCLTPVTYFEHTGSAKFLTHPENQGRAETPHPILGAMCLKVLKVPSPEKQSGQPYASEEVDYFWSQVADRIETLPAKFHQAIRNRQPSKDLQRAVMRLVGGAGVFTLTGRLRAGASFCARHNTIFQGLAADGAKLALWLLWRGGYKIVNFIHDEVLVEVPANVNLALHAEIIRHLMIRGMRAVVPDVEVDVKYAAADRWHKDAKIELDRNGQLRPWGPPA